MAIVLGPNQYGKAENRVVRIYRDTARHEIRDLNVSTSLRGDFSAAHLTGDQSRVLPTDTQKQTVFAYAKEKGVGEIEDFALALARHFVADTDPVEGARIEIEAMRLMVLKAARAMDVLGNKEARIWVSMIKAMVPERCCQIIDQAIQMHGATGVSQWTDLPAMYVKQRTLRLADGPDEVHHAVVARAERKAFEASNERQAAVAFDRGVHPGHA